MVIGAQSSKGTEPMGQVAKVDVAQRYSPGSTVETGSWKNAIGEVMREEGVMFKEFL